jgi:hypothetical protein
MQHAAPQLGKQIKYWRSFRKQDRNIGLRVDASCRFLYDDLGKGA